MSTMTSFVDAIDSLLPQTQCGKCGHAGCRPYAAALAAGEADINQCPPGGETLIHELAALVGRPAKPLDPAFGTTRPPAVAVIEERACIGCTLCIRACPVDAIVGAATLMHTVIAEECTGCELCVAPCPVDCITMIEKRDAEPRELNRLAAARARRRYDARNDRLLRERESRAARPTASKDAAQERKRATIRKAIVRAQARLQQRGR